MDLKERHALYNESFPKERMNFKKWEKTANFFICPKLLLTLDMSMFPDGMTSFVLMYSPTNKILFSNHHTKLTTIVLEHIHTNDICLADGMTAVKNLSIVQTPLVNLDLGGSLESIRLLVLPEERPISDVGIPTGMINLEELIVDVGENKTSPHLPSDMVNLKKLKLTTYIGSKLVAIPKELVKLRSVTINGEFGGITGLKNMEDLKFLNIDSYGITMVIPSVPKLSDLILKTSLKVPFSIPAITAESLIRLEIVDTETELIALPTSMVNLRHITIHALRANVFIPKDITGLLNINIKSDSADIHPTMDRVEALNLFCVSGNVLEGTTLGNVSRILMASKSKVKITLPSSLPNLKLGWVPLAVIPADMDAAGRSILTVV